MKVACVVKNDYFEDWDVPVVWDNQWIEKYMPDWLSDGLVSPEDTRQILIEIPDNSLVSAAIVDTESGNITTPGWVYDGSKFHSKRSPSLIQKMDKRHESKLKLDELYSKIDQVESKMARSTQAILSAMLNQEEPDEDDKKKFSDFMVSKVALRDEATALNASMLEPDVTTPMEPVRGRRVKTSTAAPQGE